MPCFDKKLEASRDDFTNEDQVRDVDCVLTAAEVVDIIKDKGIDFAALEESPIDKLYVEHHTHAHTHTFLTLFPVSDSQTLMTRDSSTARPAVLADTPRPSSATRPRLSMGWRLPTSSSRPEGKHNAVTRVFFLHVPP